MVLVDLEECFELKRAPPLETDWLPLHYLHPLNLLSHSEHANSRSEHYLGPRKHWDGVILFSTIFGIVMLFSSILSSSAASGWP